MSLTGVHLLSIHEDYNVVESKKSAKLLHDSGPSETSRLPHILQKEIINDSASKEKFKKLLAKSAEFTILFSGLRRNLSINIFIH